MWQITLEALLATLALGTIGGTATEQIANRKFWPPQGLLGAILIAFGGALVGGFAAYFLGFAEPTIIGLPIIPALIGIIAFMIPWWLVRSGRTSYGKKRTWQRKFRR